MARSTVSGANENNLQFSTTISLCLGNDIKIGTHLPRNANSKSYLLCYTASLSVTVSDLERYFSYCNLLEEPHSVNNGNMY